MVFGQQPQIAESVCPIDPQKYDQKERHDQGIKFDEFSFERSPLGKHRFLPGSIRWVSVEETHSLHAKDTADGLQSGGTGLLVGCPFPVSSKCNW